MIETEPLWRIASSVIALKRVGQYHRGLCPFHDDQRPSLVVGDNGFRCYACGERGGRKRWLQLTHGLAPRQKKDIDKSATKLKKLEYPDNWIAHPKAVRYFEERGLNKNSIVKFKLGYNGWRFTIPSYVGGRLMGIKLRLDPQNYFDNAPKYISAPGSRAHLFNADILKTTDDIILCEGEIDCMLLDELGLPAVTATTGCRGFNMRWLPMFSKKCIYLWLDNDAPGRESQAVLLSRLSWHGASLGITVKELKHEGGAKDVGDWWALRRSIGRPGDCGGEGR